MKTNTSNSEHKQELHARYLGHTDDGLSDIDLLQHNSSSNFTLFVDLGNLQQINLLRSNQDVIPIMQPVTNASRHVTNDSSFVNEYDEVEVSDEDDESVEEYADEEIDAENDIDTEEDDDDNSYHASNSDYKIFSLYSLLYCVTLYSF